MQRHLTTPRNNWQQAVEKIGFGFHSTDVPYWDESAYYSFTQDEIEAIEAATNTLHAMCLEAVQHVIDNNLYAQYGIDEKWIPLIVDSWNDDVPSIYGRFDLCVKDGQIKMLEYNADTPTSLYEAGIVQWFWLQDFDKNKDQFNSIHEKLIAYWKHVAPFLKSNKLHFTCVKDSLEDLTNTEYLRDCAIQAGLETNLVFIDDMGWDENEKIFVDGNDDSIKNVFKLYPWEWMINEAFGKNILAHPNETFFIEPAWKMLLSNKALLPILWQLNPNHPLLLESSFIPLNNTSYVKKPLLSREGANITLVENNFALATTNGEYGKEGYIYQALCTLPNFSYNYPVVGSWIIGQEAAGIGIREATTLITDDKSRFVPHVID
jgi:glutathionylspermidine synthase